MSSNEIPDLLAALQRSIDAAKADRPMTDQTSETTPDGLDVAAVRERVEAATEGPWVVFDMDEAERRKDEPLNEPGQGWYWVWSEPRLPYYGAVLEPDRDHPAAIGSAAINDSEGGAQEQADAEFIAHARTDIPLLLAALDEARREAEYEKAKHDECHHVFTLMEGDLNAAEARAAAAESARDAAEGALSEVRALAERQVPGPAVMCRTPKDRDDQWSAALLAILDRLAPVTTAATEGECSHGYRAPLNCGLCAGIDG